MSSNLYISGWLLVKIKMFAKWTCSKIKVLCVIAGNFFMCMFWHITNACINVVIIIMLYNTLLWVKIFNTDTLLISAANSQRSNSACGEPITMIIKNPTKVVRFFRVLLWQTKHPANKFKWYVFTCQVLASITKCMPFMLVAGFDVGFGPKYYQNSNCYAHILDHGQCGWAYCSSTWLLLMTTNWWPKIRMVTIGPLFQMEKHYFFNLTKGMSHQIFVVDLTLYVAAFELAANATSATMEWPSCTSTVEVQHATRVLSSL